MDDVENALKRLIESGMSQSEIARQAGMTQTRLHRWVRDGIPDSVRAARELVKLAAGIGQSAQPVSAEARDHARS